MRMAGSQQSLNITELFRQYGNLMYDVAYSILHHEQNAEDAVQNTLLKLMEHADRFTASPPEQMRTLVIVMTRNTARDMLRRASRRVPADMNEEETQVLLAMTESDDRIFQSRALLHCLKKLPDSEQQLLWMKYWEDLTHREIGARLGISESAAASRLRRAREHLKEIFMKEGEFE